MEQWVVSLSIQSQRMVCLVSGSGMDEEVKVMKQGFWVQWFLYYEFSSEQTNSRFLLL